MIFLSTLIMMKNQVVNVFTLVPFLNLMFRRLMRSNAKQISTAVDTQTSLHLLIQHDQAIHECDKQRSADVKPLNNHFIWAIIGNKTVTNIPHEEENNENEINNVDVDF